MKKKLGLMLAVSLLIISVCAVASAANLYYVTGNSVRVRSGPGTDYEIYGHFNRGDKVDVQWISNGWACINYGSYGDAYISSKYISRNKPTSNYVPSSSSTDNSNIYNNFVNVNYQVIVNPTNSYVNMRWAPSKSAQIIRVYYYGAPLTVIAENGSWCQVRDESTGTVGFMMKSLLLRVN